MICPKCGMSSDIKAGDTCPTCGARILPPGSVPGPAWEWRSQVGALNALVTTVKDVMINPVETFRTMNPQGGIWPPLHFFLLLSVLAVVAGAVYQPLIQNMLRGLGIPVEEPPLRGVLMIPFTIVFGMIAQFIGAFISAGILHVCAMLCGAARRDFEATFRVYCYGMGAMMPLNLFPLIGGMALMIWAPIVLCIGIREIHMTTTGQAVATVFLPMILLLGCCGIGCLAIVGVGALGAAMR